MTGSWAERLSGATPSEAGSRAECSPANPSPSVAGGSPRETSWKRRGQLGRARQHLAPPTRPSTWSTGVAWPSTRSPRQRPPCTCLRRHPDEEPRRRIVQPGSPTHPRRRASRQAYLDDLREADAHPKNIGPLSGSPAPEPSIGARPALQRAARPLAGCTWLVCGLIKESRLFFSSSRSAGLFVAVQIRARTEGVSMSSTARACNRPM